MALDPTIIRTALPATVPMVKTLNIEFGDITSTTAELRLPDQPEFHNHIGGAHAGAMFTLAESASGALVLVNFGDRLAEATPLAVEATIRYLKLARGVITATATSNVDASGVISQLQSGIRPEFTVEVALTDEEGVQTGQMSILWTLKPTKSQGTGESAR